MCKFPLGAEMEAQGDAMLELVMETGHSGNFTPAASECRGE